MIHVLTVHWKQDKWVDIQLRYLQDNIKEPFRIYAFLNYLKEDHSQKFFYSSQEAIERHHLKLNKLVEVACAESNNKDDILIFIDSDAFPVTEIMSFLHDKISQHQLVAVQRLENNGDIQPHPLFCATTVGLWQDIQGDWSPGYTWENNSGKLVTDVGGNLLKILNEKQIDWFPLLRSNNKNYHEVCFALYHDLIYHHGAGSRYMFTRKDLKDNQELMNRLKNDWVTKLVDIIPASQKTDKIKKALSPASRFGREIEQKYKKFSDNLIKNMKLDNSFYLMFKE